MRSLAVMRFLLPHVYGCHTVTFVPFVDCWVIMRLRSVCTLPRCYLHVYGCCGLLPCLLRFITLGCITRCRLRYLCGLRTFTFITAFFQHGSVSLYFADAISCRLCGSLRLLIQFYRTPVTVCTFRCRFVRLVRLVTLPLRLRCGLPWVHLGLYAVTRSFLFCFTRSAVCQFSYPLHAVYVVTLVARSRASLVCGSLRLDYVWVRLFVWTGSVCGCTRYGTGSVYPLFGPIVYPFVLVV